MGGGADQEIVECVLGHVGPPQWHPSPVTRGSPRYLEKQVNDQISALYVGGTQALPRDALGFLRKPKEHTLQLPLTTKQQWLESVNNAIARKKRHDYGNYLSKQQFMAMWVIHH